jgi:signal transduction histidine kinase
VAATGSEAGPRPRPARSARAWRLSLQLRLTVLYGACFLVGAAAVLAIAYGFVAHETSSQSRHLQVRGAHVRAFGANPSAVVAGRSSGASTSGGGSKRLTEQIETFPDGTEIITWTPQSPPKKRPTAPSGKGSKLRRIESSAQKQVDLVVDRANGALTTQRSRSLSTLLTWSGVALAAMALISILLGWLLAGRALRPLRTMSSRARRITEENLHERLSGDTQDDELGELANTFDGVLARLERAFEAQKRFVANASHELRTPVTLERVLLETALANPDADATQLRQTCERVLASTEQQQQMIEALLALARSQGGTDVDAPVDLADLAQDAITLREHRFDDITVAADLHPAPLNGDPALLERLIANLIDNAIIHNLAEDGWITVETGNQKAGSWLRVSNSGAEVPEAMVSEIFEPFRRIGGERTATATGLGLGLSIVQAIAEVHGAAIEASPVQGGGLRVEVRF